MAASSSHDWSSSQNVGAIEHERFGATEHCDSEGSIPSASIGLAGGAFVGSLIRPMDSFRVHCEHAAPLAVSKRPGKGDGRHL